MENKESTPASKTDLEQADRRQLERIQKVIDEYRIKNPGAWETFSRQIAEGMRVFRTALEKSESVGRFGWTIPYDASPREIVNIIESITDEASADFAFLEYFTADGGYALDALIEKTLANPDLGYWKDVLEEAAFCLRNKKYRVSVLALLPIFEGLCARRFAVLEFQKGEARRQVRESRRQQAIQSNSIERYAWLTFVGFAHTIFHSSDFFGLPPLALNRHWVLHGRDIPQAKLEDCLRLLLALDTISQLTPQGPPIYQ